MGRIVISDQFPLFHQIAFSDNSEKYQPTEDSTEIIEKVGQENYKLWNLELASEFLAQHYGAEVLKAFNSLSALQIRLTLLDFVSRITSGKCISISVLGCCKNLRAATMTW